MDRREAFKALGTLAAGAGLSVTPVAAHDLDRVELVILKIDRSMTQDGAQRLKDHWQQCVAGTSLAEVKTVILTDGIDVEFVRR